MSPAVLPRPSQAGWMARARYRLMQFSRGLQATLRPTIAGAGLETANRALPPAAFSLFAALPSDAQQHSLGVLQSIAQWAEANPDLAAAALLHDIGKLEAHRSGAPLGLWARGTLVLAEALAPGRMSRLARSSPASGWRYTLWVQQTHAAIGAEWARRAGCSERTVWLIAHHDADPEILATVAPPPDASLMDDLRLLQWADSRN